MHINGNSCLKSELRYLNVLSLLGDRWRLVDLEDPVKRKKPRVIREQVICSKYVLAVPQPSIILVPATAGDFPSSIHSQNVLRETIKFHFCTACLRGRAALLRRVQPGSSPGWKQRCWEERDLPRAVGKADSKAWTSVSPIWFRSNRTVGC